MNLNLRGARKFMTKIMSATTVEQDLSQNLRGCKGGKSIFGQVPWGTNSRILGVVGGVWVTRVKMPKYPA